MIIKKIEETDHSGTFDTERRLNQLLRETFQQSTRERNESRGNQICLLDLFVRGRVQSPLIWIKEEKDALRRIYLRAYFHL